LTLTHRPYFDPVVVEGFFAISVTIDEFKLDAGHLNHIAR
jgi:hypothetical protein